MGIDKVKHFAVGLILSVSTIMLVYHGMHYLKIYEGDMLSRAAVAASQLTVVAFAATWKEKKDYREGGLYDWWDWVATMIPAAFFAIIVMIYF